MWTCRLNLVIRNLVAQLIFSRMWSHKSKPSRPHVFGTGYFANFCEIVLGLSNKRSLGSAETSVVVARGRRENKNVTKQRNSHLHTRMNTFHVELNFPQR